MLAVEEAKFRGLKELEEVNDLIWEKEGKVPPKIRETEIIPESYRLEYMSDAELNSEIKCAYIFQEQNHGDLMTELYFRQGKYI